MNILFIVPYTPDRIRVRSYNLLRELGRRGHRLTLVTLWTNSREREYLSELVSDGMRVVAAPLTRRRALWNCVQTLPRQTPLQANFCWQPQLWQTLQAEILKPTSAIDVIHIEHLRGACYGARLRAAVVGKPKRAPIVWDSVDCISHLFEQSAHASSSRFARTAARFELARTRRCESFLAHQFDRTLVTSERERIAFDKLVHGDCRVADKITVLRNGVDLEYFIPSPAPRANQTILFSGKMSYHANVTAALYLLKEIMPRIWQTMPNACVQIVGQDPPRAIKNFAERFRARVHVTGYVEDIRPLLARATLSIAPIVYGAGIQNKVLEAMAMGLPVVGTPQAVSALAVRDGVEFLLGDNADLLARQVVRLLRDSELRGQLAFNGRLYVERNHDWRQVAGELENIYQEVIAVRTRDDGMER